MSTLKNLNLVTITETFLDSYIYMCVYIYMQIAVRKETLQKLLEVYHEYCNQCSQGYMVISDHLEQIPLKILMLCYDKDTKEFRFG